MKLSSVLAVAALAAASLFPAIQASGEDRQFNDSPSGFFLNLQHWRSSASAQWRISFQGRLAGQDGTGESELTFDHLDSPLILAGAGGAIDPHLSFDFAYGLGSITGGRGTDTDRFFPESGGGYEFSRSQSDISGDVKLWLLNLYADTRPHHDCSRSSWGAVAGFLHYEDNLVMRNGVQIIPVFGPFTQELNSTYDFSWDAFKVGVRRRAPIIGGLSYNGMFSLYPYVRYRGEGYWNLRTTGPDAFRSQSPNFVQKSTSGLGHEAALGLTYALSDTFLATLGYRYLYLSVKNGTDTLYYADGSSAESNLDWVKVTRKGAYLEILVLF